MNVVSDDLEIQDNAQKICISTNFTHDIRGIAVKVQNQSDWLDYQNASSFKSVIGNELEEWLTEEHIHNIGASS